MVSYMFFMLGFFLMINLFKKFILFIFYQNYLFMFFIMILMSMPLNNINFWVKIYYFMGMDYFSFGLIILSIWVMGLMIMVSGDNLFNLNYLYYYNIMNFMIMFLILCFMMVNVMMFYLFFEASLLPIFFMIIGWGFQVDRIQAGFYMMLYTLLGSLPLLLVIFLIYQVEYTLFMNFIEIKFTSFIIYIFMIMAFLIKMPMYFVHLWLPKAHVEAPLTGSMILAGVMLKLGSYGLMRFIMMMFKLSLKFNKFIIVVSLLGGVFSSLICLYQVDMKMLVAYSSVVHMSLLMSGLLTLMNWGIYGSFLMMIAHGLCSSGLFYLVNISYVRFKSRSLIINKGLINFFPSLSLMWFLFCSSNLSFPPSLNLWSELMLLNSLIMWDLTMILILMFLMLFGALYSLYLYSFSQHGGIYKSLFEVKSITILEFMVLILHWVPLNMMFLVIYLYF